MLDYPVALPKHKWHKKWLQKREKGCKNIDTRETGKLELGQSQANWSSLVAVAPKLVTNNGFDSVKEAIIVYH